jgi:DNA-binding MarR family transcriptional regulator
MSECDQVALSEQIERLRRDRFYLERLHKQIEADRPVEISIPPQELRTILLRLRDRAAALYNREPPEREASLGLWERTALIRDTCDELTARLWAGK